MSWSFARSSRKSSEKGEGKLGKKPSSPKGLKWTNSAIKSLVHTQCNLSEKSEVEAPQSSRSKAAKSLHAKETNTKKVDRNHQNSQIKDPFPVILYDILENASTDPNIAKIVSWHPDGNRFRVHDRAAFETLIQPVHFPTQSDFASFRRQLNLYDYKRISKDLKEEDGYYFHPKFMRGKRPLCYQMCRNLATTKAGRMKKKKSRFLKKILEGYNKKRHQGDGSSTASLTRATNNLALSFPMNQHNLSSNQSLAVGMAPIPLHTSSVGTVQSTGIGAPVPVQSIHTGSVGTVQSHGIGATVQAQSIHANSIGTVQSNGIGATIPSLSVTPLQVPTSNNTDGFLNGNFMNHSSIGTNLHGLDLNSLTTAQIQMLADNLKQVMEQQQQQQLRQQQVQAVNSTNLTNTNTITPLSIQSTNIQPQTTTTYVSETDANDVNSQPFRPQAYVSDHSRPNSEESNSRTPSPELPGRKLQQRTSSNLIAIKQLTNNLAISDDAIYATDDQSLGNESLKSSRTLNTASEESSKASSHGRNMDKGTNIDETDNMLNEMLTKNVSSEDSALFFQNALAWVDNISKVN
ncbi:hypothetical protein CTEN210_14863 [Chaetoceros tenuissimus]|uniref:HSF-type DNA-binding domain-containing protein n=1 Tax=Chaetoceros tenuissimus TaxID=426638 RepID=A0AAD3D6I6_9STRA|nr:hypothetical protein CTEN210_14863 [Chaetoceros tenuissimus]